MLKRNLISGNWIPNACTNAASCYYWDRNYSSALAFTSNMNRIIPTERRKLKQDKKKEIGEKGWHLIDLIEIVALYTLKGVFLFYLLYILYWFTSNVNWYFPFWRLVVRFIYGSISLIKPEQNGQYVGKKPVPFSILCFPFFQFFLREAGK